MGIIKTTIAGAREQGRKIRILGVGLVGALSVGILYTATENANQAYDFMRANRAVLQNFVAPAAYAAIGVYAGLAFSAITAAGFCQFVGFEKAKNRLGCWGTERLMPALGLALTAHGLNNFAQGRAIEASMLLVAGSGAIFTAAAMMRRIRKTFGMDVS